MKILGRPCTCHLQNYEEESSMEALEYHTQFLLFQFNHNLREVERRTQFFEECMIAGTKNSRHVHFALGGQIPVPTLEWKRAEDRTTSSAGTHSEPA